MTGIAESTDIAIIGAGSIGIAVGYYLVVNHGAKRLVLIDSGDPMALTSAQSGENYRNWWPHPVMTAFTDDAITLLEDIARVSDNRIHMTRRGYALATRRSAPEDLIADLHRGYGAGGAALIRVHENSAAPHYRPAISSDWETAPNGVDVLLDRGLILENFPTLAPDIATILHIRRAGDISAQQLGQFMLEAIRAAGGRVRRARVMEIAGNAPFSLTLEESERTSLLRAERVVNAAGPFFAEVAAMLGETVPVRCVYQQKIAFEDRERALPRTLPFTIDLDSQELPWSEEERALLASEPESAAWLERMPGGIHRRPEGGDAGSWIKLGWAYNTTPSDPAGAPPIDRHFPELVLRGASRLTPSLRSYVGRLPRGARHYGGYYTMTRENWPLIGPMRAQGAFMAGALSGFGTMAATATGALCAAWIADAARPDYAPAFTLDRYDDHVLMAELTENAAKSIL